jgi:hypothetical protein
MARAGAIQFKVRGRTAVIVIAAIVVVALISGYHRLHQMRANSETLRARIQTELELAHLRGLPLERAAEPHTVAITRFDIRGGFNKRATIRVEFTENGAPPPGGNAVRYYRADYSNLFGWYTQSLRTALKAQWDWAFPR